MLREVKAFCLSHCLLSSGRSFQPDLYVICYTGLTHISLATCGKTETHPQLQVVALLFGCRIGLARTGSEGVSDGRASSDESEMQPARQRSANQIVRLMAI